jgi:hypothetical protein
VTASTEASLVAYSNELAAIQAQIKALTEAEKSVKTHIADLLAGQVGDIIAEGRTVFTVAYSRRFDPELAHRILIGTPDLLAACSTTVVDASKAKAVLPPAVYELCQAQSEKPTIKPKVA